MNTEKPTLHATLKKTPGDEVRHLLIYPVDGDRETKLTQFSNGVETPIATGTSYEIRQEADATARRWAQDEGFELQNGDKLVFEPLERTVALAIKLGYVVIYDQRFRKMVPRQFNVTGAVPLSTWPGMTAKNGGSYVYALGQLKIHAQPSLPPGTPKEAPNDPKEFAAFMLQMKARLDEIGPYAEFLMGGA